MANQSALRSDTASNQGGSSEMAGIIDQQAKEIHQLKEKIEITEKESISLKSELYKYKNQIVTIDDHDIKVGGTGVFCFIARLFTRFSQTYSLPLLREIEDSPLCALASGWGALGA